MSRSGNFRQFDGAKELALLTLTRSGPGAAIEGELRRGSILFRFVNARDGLVAYITTTMTARRLIGAHCGAGGRFVANQFGGRDGRNEYWSVIVSPTEVESVAYHGDRSTFLTASDFDGAETVAEEIDEACFAK